MNDQDHVERAFEELKSLLLTGAEEKNSDYGRYFDVTAADGDAVIILSSACKQKLSDRFLEVMGELKDAVQDSKSNELGIFFQRLLRIIELSEKYPVNIDRGLLLEDEPVFSLKGDDLQRVFKLSSDMRKIILGSEIFDHAHKVRLLDRVTAIEKELHKEKGRLDVVLAGVVDVGDALGKFGEKVEPLAKRIKELSEIAKRGSRQYDQLPSPEEIKKLPPPDTTEE